MLLEEKRTEAAKKTTNSVFEVCVLCGKQTDIRRDTPVDFRDAYICGCGQLCRSCYDELYQGK